MSKENLLLVVSGPSGVGKGTIFAEVMSELGSIEFSVSATTRDPRPSEIEGVNYFFKSREEFERMIKNGEFLEYANVFKNIYGTPKKYVLDKLIAGRDILLEIDVQGAMMVKDSYPNAVFIFIAPPSISDLEKRLKNRATEDEAVMNLRLSKAKEEISYADKFDYIVINDELNEAIKEVKSIIIAEKCKTNRNEKFLKSVIF